MLKMKVRPASLVVLFLSAVSTLAQTAELFGYNDYSTFKSLYFEVNGGSVSAEITNLAVFTYYTTHLQVYSKPGRAGGYEHTPCAWKLVAETRPGWNGGTFRRVYPEWNSNGFDPVVLNANSTVSFYVTNVGSSNKIMGRAGYRMPGLAPYDEYTTFTSSWARAYFGDVTMTTGKKGDDNGDLFRLYDRDAVYALSGGVQLRALGTETLEPGTNVEPSDQPTAAPTALSSSGSLESPMSGDDLEFTGLQFDVNNFHTETVRINQISARFANAGSHRVEVWMKNGSHQGTDGSCQNSNNWCDAWTKLSDSSVASSGPEDFTSTGTLNVDIEGETTVAFAIVAGSDAILTTDGQDDSVVQNGDLRINLASPIQDYYGMNVQSMYPLGPPSKIYQGIVTYEKFNSRCATLSLEDWVVLNPEAEAGATLQTVPDYNYEDDEYVPPPSHGEYDEEGAQED